MALQMGDGNDDNQSKEDLSKSERSKKIRSSKERYNSELLQWEYSYSECLDSSSWILRLCLEIQDEEVTTTNHAFVGHLHPLESSI
ncbi:hypothetical protein Tco_0581561 [Tanacetum coccineum]